MLPTLSRNASRYLQASGSRTASSAKRTSTRIARTSAKNATMKPCGVVASYGKVSVYSQSRSYYAGRVMKYAGAEEAKEGSEGVKEEVIGEDASALKAELEATRKALEETSKALSEQKEKLARSYADLENTVRIAKRDVAHAKEFGIKGFAVKMFDVLDTVELCLMNLPQNAEPNSHLDSAIIALDSTKKQFGKVMADFDVKPVEAQVGDKFDANFHNAVFEMDAHAHDTPMKSIGAVLKQGWTRSGTLLRPTHVGVVMRPHPSAKKD